MASTDIRAEDDPVEKAELVRLTRADARRRGDWVITLFYIAFAVSVALTGLLPLVTGTANQSNLLGRRVLSPSETMTLAVNLALVALLIGTQLVLVMQALLLASDAVAREKQGATWELLLMAGYDGDQIVVGKWWAIQGYLLQTHRVVMIARAAAVVWLGLSAVGGSISSGSDVFALALAPALVLLYTVVDLSLATAAGLLASALARRGLAFIVAVGLHVMTALVFLMCYPLVDGLIFDPRAARIPPLLLYRYSLPLALIPTPLDGGALLGLRLQSSLPVESWGLILGLIALNLGTLGALTWLLLRLAGGFARIIKDKD